MVRKIKIKKSTVILHLQFLQPTSGEICFYSNPADFRKDSVGSKKIKAFAKSGCDTFYNFEWNSDTV